MGGWIKPKLLVNVFGLGKDKELSTPLECVWHADCPSHVYETKLGVKLRREKSLKPKLKCLEVTQPNVRMYKCGYCGMVFMCDVAGNRIPEAERAHVRNPAFIGGAKVV